MKTAVKNLTKTRVELTVTLDTADLSPYTMQAELALAGEITVPGFRKGKAPLSQARSWLDPERITRQALDLAVRATVVKAFDQAKKQPIQVPEVTVTKFVPAQLVEYTAVADILPEVKVGDFKNLKVKKPKLTVSAKDIQEVLDKIAESYAEKQVVRRSARRGDEVIIDFTGTKDGVKFPGGSAKNHALILGSGAFIPGFEDGLVGHSVGDQFDLELTFPKNYPESTLAGAKTVFQVLIKQINELKKPEFNAEFAKKCGNFKDMAELKADIKKNLTSQNNYKASEKYRDELIAALVKNSTVEAPEVMISDQIKMIKADVERNAERMGISYNEYVKRSGKTQAVWDEEMRRVATERVKASLVLQILAIEQKITVDDAAVDAKIAELKDVYQNSKEALANLKNPRVRQEIRSRLTIEQTIDFLIQANSQKPSAKNSTK